MTQINAYAALQANAPLEPYSYQVAALGANEVELDVLNCGICHSDLSIIENAWGISEFPTVPGHEVIGTIAARGSAVTHLKIGQTVGLGWHSGYCNTCTQCYSGDHNLCSGAQATIVGHHGGFADKVRAAANAVVPLPAGIDPTSAGPLFCGGITVFNPLVQFGIKPTDKVAVIGIGGLGHLALQFLNAWGCQVTAFTSSESKQAQALELGAHATLNSADPKALKSAAGRFDLVLSTVNVKLDWNAYVNTLSPRGRLHFVGATLEPLELQIFPLIASQRSISGSPVGSPAMIAQMLDFAARHKIQPKVETFPMDQVNAALDHLRSGKARYRIVLTR
jgi:uncharacterized zinc-type alcohol dehydrogenase-like protein